jgi:hypothetical protein
MPYHDPRRLSLRSSLILHFHLFLDLPILRKAKYYGDRSLELSTIHKSVGHNWCVQRINILPVSSKSNLYSIIFNVKTRFM